MTAAWAAPDRRSIPRWSPRWPDKLTRPFLLAGGISDANRGDYESLAARELFLGVDVDTNARDADGHISADRVAAIARVVEGSPRCLACSSTRCSSGRLPIIMEVKRSDGEGAELMGERTIAEIVGQYVDAGAPCISVVTGRWFGGDDDMLREVAGLTDRPLLKKDFITREKQIVAAKEMGASAVLLTAKILPAKTFQHLIELALSHGLTPFVEVVDQAELDSVIHPEDCIDRGQQQGHQHARARAGRHRHQPLAARGDDRRPAPLARSAPARSSTRGSPPS